MSQNAHGAKSHTPNARAERKEMLEFLALPAIAVAAALVPKRKTKDINKIKKVFENTGLGIKKGDTIQYPKLLEQSHKESHSTYIFSLPLGLQSQAFETILPAIQEGINKEIDSDFDNGVFKLFVYNQSLPNKWNYDESLLQPNSWEFAVGKNHKGIIFHDFEKYQHVLVGGVTRYGKTVLLKNILTTILLNNPNDAEFYIIDLKGGLEFHKFAEMPQVKEVACDLFQAQDLLCRLVLQLKHDEEYFKKNMYTNIVDTPIKKRKFIIIDESAQLSPSMYADKDIKLIANAAQNCLGELARLSGGLGYRIILATQYPVSLAVPPIVKANIVARIAFICANNTASRVLLDEGGAEDLPAIPGRCIYLIEKQRILQVPYLDDKKMFKLMEERKDEFPSSREDRKVVNDDRQIGSSNNQASAWNTRK